MKIRKGNQCEYALKIMNDYSNTKDRFSRSHLAEARASGVEDTQYGKVAPSWHNGPCTAGLRVGLCAWQGLCPVSNAMVRRRT